MDPLGAGDDLVGVGLDLAQGADDEAGGLGDDRDLAPAADRDRVGLDGVGKRRVDPGGWLGAQRAEDDPRAALVALGEDALAAMAEGSTARSIATRSVTWASSSVRSGHSPVEGC